MSDAGDYHVTSLRLPGAALALLRRAAVARAERCGGRVSVSAVMADLIEKNRAVLLAPAAKEEASGAD